MATDWLRYANQGATRNLPLDPRLVQAMSFLPELGLQMEVFSGGQPAKGSGLPRVGSTRHDHGNAADVFFSRGGQRLDWANPADREIFGDIVRRASANGVTGIGAGPGYMQPGSMHIGFGSPGVWGAGGKGANAPDWLRSAYNGAPAGAAPPAAVAAANARMLSPQPMATQPGQMQPATTPFGDLVTPRQVPAVPFGTMVLDMMARREEKAEEEAAEMQRKAALMSVIESLYA